MNWVAYMMFIAMIGGIGTLKGPIIGTVIFFGLRELITDQLRFSAGWYLVALGLVAVIVMLWSPRGMWPPLRDRFGLKLLGVGRRAPAASNLAPLGGKAGQLPHRCSACASGQVVSRPVKKASTHLPVQNAKIDESPNVLGCACNRPDPRHRHFVTILNKRS